MSLSRSQAQPIVSPAASSDFAYRVQFAVTAALAVSTIIMMVVYLVLALQWRAQPFLGVLTSNTLTVNRAAPIVAAQWSALEAGLEPGDVLVAINGQDLGTQTYEYARGREVLSNFLANAEDGAPVRIDVLRGDMPAYQRAELSNISTAE